MKRPAKQRTIREAYQASQDATNYYAAMAGMPPVDFVGILPAKRVVVHKSDPSELEAAVSSEVAQVLAAHPNVWMAFRQNSGSASLPGRDGKDMPVWFYKVIKQPKPIRVSDYWGFLKGEERMRPFAFEVKRRDWKYSASDIKEREQLAFLDCIRIAGGVAAFVTSGEQVLKLLKGG
jgi:hypothetical protein